MFQDFSGLGFNGLKNTGLRRINYAQLALKARQIGSLLHSECQLGDRVLLQYPPGLGYITAFFGCMYAGVIAVPAYPPRPRRPDLRLNAIALNSRATAALTTNNVFKNFESVIDETKELSTLKWLKSDDISQARVRDSTGKLTFPDIRKEDLAFLQYTSGSTSIPKGVKVSHGNLMHNLKHIHHFFGHSPESKGVIWLPPYHDMGLIGGILQPLYGGFPAILTPPAAFLRSPVSWLKMISRYKGTTSGGPNFAYELCHSKGNTQTKRRSGFEPLGGGV